MNLTADENFILSHTMMWGSPSYPLRKRSGKWFVDGIRDRGACPTAFKTKKAAAAQWELFLDELRRVARG